MSKFSIFYNNIQGNRVEVSSSVPTTLYQCMDLAYLWVFINDIPKATIQQARAKDVYLRPNALTRQYFEIIKNTPSFIPKTGDLVVFNIGAVGHISIATGEGNLKTFKSFDQNWGSGVAKYPRIHLHDYNQDQLLGVLRIKK